MCWFLGFVVEKTAAPTVAVDEKGVPVVRGDVPGVQAVQVVQVSRRGARQFMVQTVRLTMDILRYVAMSLLCGCAAPQVQVVARPEVVDFPSWRRGRSSWF